MSFFLLVNAFLAAALPVNVDRGRQLFVDDCLVESTDLVRTVHKPQKYGPVLSAETELENGRAGNKCAAPISGGVWWDDKYNIYRMWYEAGFVNTVAYAESRDAVHWTRKNLDIVPGTNRVLPLSAKPVDSSTIWIDYDAEKPEERYKMSTRTLGGGIKKKMELRVSADGLHWSEPVESGGCGDRSTFYYNPFSKRWIFSLRAEARKRLKAESADFMGSRWDADTMGIWLQTDSLDKRLPEIGHEAQLYNFDAVPYESIMIAFPQILLGPTNRKCEKTGTPKITNLGLAYSRDGVNWDRRDRDYILESSRKAGTPDRGYVQSNGGLFTIAGDKLLIHYTAFEGDSTRLDQNPSSRIFRNGLYYGGSSMLAVIRRDGFVSYGGTGGLVTRPLEFSGTFLFINACGTVRAEILDENGNVIEGYSAAESVPFHGDSTIARLRWRRHSDLSALKGRNVRIRFVLDDASLYSFWISPDRKGASFGWTAAGGPGLEGGIDTAGKRAYKAVRGKMWK